DVETGQRGFVITGDEAFLTPYTDAISEIGALRNDFAQVIEEDTPPPRRDILINDLITRRLKISAQVIALVRAGKQSEASEIVKDGAGKAAMDSIRAMVHEAGIERAKRLALQQKRQDVISTAARITEIVGIIVLALAAANVIRQSRLAIAAQRKADESQAAAV